MQLLADMWPETVPDPKSLPSKIARQTREGLWCLWELTQRLSYQPKALQEVGCRGKEKK